MQVRLAKKADIASRLRQVRVDRFGEEGVEALAEALGLPARTWENYEAGVTIPGEVLLCFLDFSAINPRWLLTGRGSPSSPSH